MTRSGIEPATFRFVAQHLNRLRRHRVAHIYIYIYIYIYMCVCVYTHTHTHIHTVLLPASSVEVLRNIPGP